MARFYFHEVVNDRVDDLLAHELPGLAAARRHAMRCVRAITAFLSAVGVDVSRCLMEVESEIATAMLVLPFKFIGRTSASSRTLRWIKQP
jgi:hypothetical protein